MSRPVVVFDYDGTLVDSYAIKRESYWRAVSEEFQIAVADRRVVEISYARTSGAHRFEQLADTAKALRRTVTDSQRESFSRRYSAYNEAAQDHMLEFPSARAVLERLGQRWDLVLTSGLPHVDLVADVQGRGLAGFFVEIDGGDKGRALDRLKTLGREVVLLVGDTPHDQAIAESRRVPFYLTRGDADLLRLPEFLAR